MRSAPFRNGIRACVVVTAIMACLVECVFAQETYRLGPQDVVGVSVFGHQELSGKFTVAADGTIVYPLLGSVKAAGLTVAEFQTVLAHGLSDGFLRAPQVSAEIVQYLSKRVYAIGEVRTPGAISLTGTSTLLDALTKAGALSEQAGGDILLLRRKSGTASAASGPLSPGQPDVEEVARVSVQQMRRGSASFGGTLLDGDTIFVPRAENIFVLGNVNNPGSYVIEPGVTTVLRAISLAGGASELGTTRRVRVSRIVNGQKVDVNVQLNDLLEAGDTVTVGTRRF